MNWNNLPPVTTAWPTQAVAVPAAEPDLITPALKERLAVERLPQDADGLIMLWERQKKAFEVLKEDEMDLRKVATKVLLKRSETVKEGVNNIDLGQGYVAKVGVKYNYKLDSDNDKVEEALDKIELVGNEGKFIADRLVKWSADLSVTEYKKLVEDAPASAAAKQILDIINGVVTVTDGAPTLEIKEPKVKK